MTSSEGGGTRILGSLRSADGKGVVRMQDRFDTDIDDVWSALTDPRRLARWYGEVEGDLRLGGEFRARVLASGSGRSARSAAVAGSRLSDSPAGGPQPRANARPGCWTPPRPRPLSRCWNGPGSGT